MQSSLIAFFALALRYTWAQPKAASPFDEQVEDQATFEGLLENIQNCYHYIGVLDSVIRERLFDQLATIKKVDYEEIYNLYFKR